ncbi:MAG: helix-turn-helix transcriptional regulator [Deltaproteobacteria bacterium]|nr:helix-turn-helix transcriptional regulator [Deltaproteobacteria bacterium]
MPRPVTKELSLRRRERLAELFDALGAARGAKLTQRAFAASIGREQGTIAAILGGHRALGGDVMLAVVQAYGLPPDYFDSPVKPDPRPFARAVVGAVPDLVGGGRKAPPAKAVSAAPAAAAPEGDPGLEEALEALRPDHAVTVALRAIQRAAGQRATTEWLRLAVGAQSAHERGTLLEWYDRALATPRRADRPGVLRPVGSSPRAKAVDRP